MTLIVQNGVEIDALRLQNTELKEKYGEEIEK